MPPVLQDAMSTYLDDVLTAPTAAVRAMVAAGDDDAAVLGNGSLLMTTRVHDAMRTASTLCDGAPVFNFASWAPRPGAASLQSQSLYLRNGLFTETWTVPGGGATTSLVALRQHVRCALQTLDLPPGQYVHAPDVPDSLVLDGGDHTYVSSKGAAVPCLRLRAHARCDPTKRFAYLGAYLRATGVTWDGLDLKPFAPNNRLTVAGAGSIHVLHCVAYGEDADAVVTRIAVSAMVAANNQSAGLHTGNTLRWASIWRSGLEITPRSPTDAAVKDLNVAIRAAKYRLMSTRRDTGSLSLGVPGGAWSRASTAALVVLLPDYAKGAASDGLRAALVSPDVLDPAAPRLEALASAVLDVWNAFRVTLDRAWTRTVSRDVYAAADILAQRIEIAGLPFTDPATLQVPLTKVGTVSTRFEEAVVDHGLTTHLVRQALAAATQIAYEVRDVASASWMAAYNQLVVPRDGGTFRYSAADATSATEDDQVLSYHPYVFAPPAPSMILANVMLAGRALAATTASDPDAEIRFASIAVLATTSNLSVGTTNAAISAAYAALNAEVAALSPLWRSISQDPTADAAATGHFLAMMAYGFARLRIYGIVDRDGVHIQRAQLTNESIVLLPAEWLRVLSTQVTTGAAAPTVRAIGNSR